RLYDAEGRLWLSSDAAKGEATDVSNREDFLTHKLAPPASKPQPLYIGMPLRTTDGQWRYPLSRRVSGPRGEFRGMAVANLEPETMEKYFATLDVGDHGLVVMLRQDAILLIRRPRLESAIGRLPPDSLIPRLAAQAGSGAFTFTSRFDR